jgi:hypothetical protein
MKTPGSAEGAAPARTRPVLRRLSLLPVALAFAVFAASALAGSYAAQASFLVTDAIPPNSQGPVFTNPTFSAARRECGQSVTASQATGTVHYKAYRFQVLRGGPGAALATCANVSLLVHSGSATAVGYIGVFNASQPGTNFAGSVGGLGAGQAGDFSYFAGLSSIATPPLGFDVVVYETTPNGGAVYTLLVEGNTIIMPGSGTPTATSGLQSFRASSAPKGVLVRWRTRLEGDALGFNLYRGDAKKVRVTRSMVRASGNGRGHSYSYLDRSASKSKRAPYYLEVVQRGGSKIMFGPAQAVR